MDDDARRGGRRPEDEHAACAARVGHARRRRRVGSDDDQIHSALRGDLGDRKRVGDVNGDVLGEVSGAGVAGSDDDRHIGRIAPARPGQRVLASAGSDDEDSPYSHSIVDGGLLETS